MDGEQRTVSRSLQFSLSLWLSVAIILVAIAAAAISFSFALQEANELQDDQLRYMAALINRHVLSTTNQPQPLPSPDADPESRIIVQLLHHPGSTETLPPGDLPGVSSNLPDGMQTVTVNHTAWRLYVRELGAGWRVGVGQQMAVRNEIARSSAMQTLLPFLLLVPLLLLLLAKLVRTMFKPVKTLATGLDRRSEQDLHEIPDAGLPGEIRPFVVAINRLLRRVAHAMSAQRRFVADAAHELRTPLTALSLQAERLGEAEMSPQARERLAVLFGGIQRSRKLLDQLLTLARVQDGMMDRSAPVSLQHSIRHVLEDLLPLAEAKSLDLGVIDETDAHIPANPVELQTLIKNLVDNAIRYTPAGGRVDLAIRAKAGLVVLEIEDSGPGIAPNDRERVFIPFSRLLGSQAEGSGLGLSIVRTIAYRLGAKIELGYADEAASLGLRVRVIFPPPGVRQRY